MARRSVVMFILCLYITLNTHTHLYKYDASLKNKSRKKMSSSAFGLSFYSTFIVLFQFLDFIFISTLSLLSVPYRFLSLFLSYLALAFLFPLSFSFSIGCSPFLLHLLSYPRHTFSYVTLSFSFCDTFTTILTTCISDLSVSSELNRDSGGCVVVVKVKVLAVEVMAVVGAVMAVIIMRC